MERLIINKEKFSTFSYKVRHFTQKHLQDRDPSHSINHSFRVVENCARILDVFDKSTRNFSEEDIYNIYVMAMMHDILDKKYATLEDHIAFEENISIFLDENKLPSYLLRLMKGISYTNLISGRTDDFCTNNFYFIVVSEADMLDSIGIRGYNRCIDYQISLGLSNIEAEAYALKYIREKSERISGMNLYLKKRAYELHSEFMQVYNSRSWIFYYYNRGPFIPMFTDRSTRDPVGVEYVVKFLSEEYPDLYSLLQEIDLSLLNEFLDKNYLNFLVYVLEIVITLDSRGTLMSNKDNSYLYLSSISLSVLKMISSVFYDFFASKFVDLGYFQSRDIASFTYDIFPRIGSFDGRRTSTSVEKYITDYNGLIFVIRDSLLLGLFSDMFIQNYTYGFRDSCLKIFKIFPHEPIFYLDDSISIFKTQTSFHYPNLKSILFPNLIDFHSGRRHNEQAPYHPVFPHFNFLSNDPVIRIWVAAKKNVPLSLDDYKDLGNYLDKVPGVAPTKVLSRLNSVSKWKIFFEECLSPYYQGNLGSFFVDRKIFIVDVRMVCAAFDCHSLNSVTDTISRLLNTRKPYFKIVHKSNNQVVFDYLLSRADLYD